MTELQQRILDILNQPQLAGFATVTANGQPWVRYVMAVGAPDMTIRFASCTTARKVTQIAANPEVHLTCGVTNPHQMAPYLQIQGRAVFTAGRAERHAFWSDMLTPIFDGPDDPRYGIVIVTPYRIEYCTPGLYVPEAWEAQPG